MAYKLAIDGAKVLVIDLDSQGTITLELQQDNTDINKTMTKIIARLRESVPYVKVYQYNPKLNGYGDNGQRNLKLWQLLHTYWLPNTY